MRKHTVRHLLHACLDLLPILLIPVFMIYSHRHEINDSSIQLQEKVSVNFNQLRMDNKTNTNTGITFTIVNGSLGFNGTSTMSTIYATKVSDTYTIQNHIYLYRLKDYTEIPVLTIYSFANQGSGTVLFNGNFQLSSIDGNYYRRFQSSQDNGSLELGIRSIVNETYDSFCYLDIFDLTQLGLVDKTNEEINLYFPNTYQFTLSHKELINGDLITYNDTDIMSQFTYQMYNAVDKYFNIGNVFGMNNLYQWFELNIFGGSAPLYIYVVWNIVLYDFVMDLIFLLYALFMWFIDMTKRLIEKPLDSIK